MTAYGLVPFQLTNPPQKCYEALKPWLDDFRLDEGKDLKVGLAGFCYGGYAATKLAQGELASNGKTFIDAAFTAHPSFLQVPSDIEKIKLPYSLCVGDADFALPKKEVDKIVVAFDNLKHVRSEVVVIPGAKHGFALRYDQNDKAEQARADKAEDQVVEWFAKYLQ
ncbi:hypothetical protein LTR84_005813 [Exophiala bonariae]|uniref:Dienelactone hydrolase domain-containing protein n=1 Tax=Exophiala bonariae TaxID=1690606 RepID=A0AAV9N3C1_9EURO|nr:hypothetical protein LTR84_005813 [Exophiala bonariae]